MDPKELEKLRAEALKELDRVDHAQTELKQAYMGLTRLRLKAAQDAQALHKALDLVASW